MIRYSLSCVPFGHPGEGVGVVGARLVEDRERLAMTRRPGAFGGATIIAAAATPATMIAPGCAASFARLQCGWQDHLATAGHFYARRSRMDLPITLSPNRGRTGTASAGATPPSDATAAGASQRMCVGRNALRSPRDPPVADA